MKIIEKNVFGTKLGMRELEGISGGSGLQKTDIYTLLRHYGYSNEEQLLRSMNDEDFAVELMSFGTALGVPAFDIVIHSGSTPNTYSLSGTSYKHYEYLHALGDALYTQ